jgi:hypothetical protein
MKFILFAIVLGTQRFGAKIPRCSHFCMKFLPSTLSPIFSLIFLIPGFILAAFAVSLCHAQCKQSCGGSSCAITNCKGDFGCSCNWVQVTPYVSLVIFSDLFIFFIIFFLDRRSVSRSSALKFNVFQCSFSD